MRVVTGIAKGCKLVSPSNRNIRPTTDRIKESVFNIISNRILDCTFLDCFSGSGSVGIEALSRGAKKCVFIDKNINSISLVKKNLEITRLKENAILINNDFHNAFSMLSNQVLKFDIIFMDPPYNMGLIEPCLKKINDFDLLKEDGIIIAEHDSNTQLSDKINSLIKFREKKYGNTTISFYHWGE